MAYKVNGTEFSSTANGQNFANVTVADGFFKVKADYDNEVFQGSNFGYFMGGRENSTPGRNTIEKFPFAVDENTADVGDLTRVAFDLGGHSSGSHGFSSGGGTNPNAATTVIDKFSFANGGNSTDHGDLSGSYLWGHSTASSVAHGYTTGGISPFGYNRIQKFPFATTAGASGVGSTISVVSKAAGHSSTTDGYVSGGSDIFTPTNFNVIQKFPFASDGPSTDVGDTLFTGPGKRGVSSSEHGYIAGGSPPSPFAQVNIIERFPFASNSNSADVGDLTQAQVRMGEGVSGTTHGYFGGRSDYPAQNYYNTIDKFAYASSSNATDVGNMLSARDDYASAQN